MGLEQVVPRFGIEPFLLPARSGQTRRRSSFTDARERALVFFWESPSGRVYLIRTQAPWVIRTIQRAVGSEPDGKYGELTNRAVIADARRNGRNVADSWPIQEATAYALSRALFGGGRIAFPAPTEYPDINHPRLATMPDGSVREFTYLGAYDVELGREVPIIAGPDGTRRPANSTEPPAQVADSPVQTTTGQTTQQTSTTTTGQQTSTTSTTSTGGTATTGGQTGTQTGQTTTTGQTGGMQPPPAPQQTLVPTGGQTSGVMTGGMFTGQGGLGQWGGGMSGFTPLLQPPDKQSDGSCPKHFIDEDGRCKLVVYRIIDGRMVIDGRGGLQADFADPKTYTAADRTPGVIAATVLTLLGAAAGVLGKNL